MFLDKVFEIKKCYRIIKHLQLRGTKQSNQRINKSTTEEFWALKDLNFKINQGSMSNHNKVYENLIDVLQNNASITTNAFDAMKTVEIISKIYCSK